MSQPPTRPIEGQITAPNPIELFWEKNKRTVNALLVVLLLALVGNYGYRFWKQQQVNAEWSRFAKATKLDAGYTTDGAFASILDNPQYRMQFMNLYLENVQTELTTKMAQAIKETSISDLDKLIRERQGTAVEPLVIWIAANRAYLNDDWQGARTHLKDLQARFPEHFLCQSTDYPPQFRTDLNEGKEPAKDGKKPKPNLAEVQKGSLAAKLLAQVDANEKFRAEQKRLYAFEEPDPKPIITLEVEGLGNIKIRLYSKLAPKHCEQFVKNIEEKFYEGQRIDEIRRRATGISVTSDAALEFHLGLANSKEDDRTKWIKEPGKKLDWEENSLSHFPGMVAAEAESEGKSSGERIWINANDCAGQRDGDRVIFGRVVEGLEIVERIVDQPFATEAEGQSGAGKPRDNIRISKITIEK